MTGSIELPGGLKAGGGLPSLQIQVRELSNFHLVMFYNAAFLSVS